MDLMNIDSNDLEHLTQIFHNESQRETLVKAADEEIIPKLNTNPNGVPDKNNKTAAKNKGKTSKKRKSNQITGDNSNVSALTNNNNENNDGIDMDLVDDNKAKPSKMNKRQKKMKDNSSNNNGQVEETEMKKGKRKEKICDVTFAEKTENKPVPKDKEINLIDDKEKAKEKEINSKEKSTNKETVVTTEKKNKKDKKEEKISKIKKGKEKEKDKDKEKEIVAVSVKKSEFEEGDPKKTVLDYMITVKFILITKILQQNRPYSLINIFDNLHATIKKGQLQKILDSLADSGDLICKEYNSKIYLASQKNFPKVDEKVMNELDEAIESSKNTLSGLKDTNSSFLNELKNIQVQYTDSELNNQIELKKMQLGNLELELKKWEEGKIEKISEDKMREAEKNYNLNKNNFKKIKKNCIDIVDVFCENMEMKRVDLMNLIGIETDTEVVLRLPNA